MLIEDLPTSSQAAASVPPKTPSPRRSTTWQLVGVAVAFVLIGGALLGRFALAPHQDIGVRTAVVNTYGTATPFATAATTSNQASIGTNGTAVSAVTPIPTAINTDYPDPRDPKLSLDQIKLYDGSAIPDQVITVSLYGQYLQVFDKGKLVKWTYITTGRPTLETPTGMSYVFEKKEQVTFIPLSTDPLSPLYEYPSTVNYGLQFREGGFYIHDAWWRTTYGPTLQYNHWDPGRGEWQPGSHGCVNTPLEVVAWLYTWANFGTQVIVY